MESGDYTFSPHKELSYELPGSRINQTAIPAPTKAAMINTMTSTREEGGWDAFASTAPTVGTTAICITVAVTDVVIVGGTISVG